MMKKKKKLTGGDGKTLRWLYSQAKPELWKILILVVTGAISAMMMIALAFVSRSLIDHAVAGNREGLTQNILLLFGLILAGEAMGMLDQFLNEHCLVQIRLNLQDHILSTLVEKQYSAVAAYHTGGLQNRLFSDVAVVTNGIVGIVPSIAFLTFKLVGAAASLAILMPRLMVMAFAVGVLVFLTITVLRDRMKAMHKAVQEQEDQLRSVIQEVLGNLLIIKIFGAGERMKARTRVFQQRYRKARMKRRVFGIVAGAGFGFIFEFGYFAAMAWGAVAIMQGTMTYGTLTAVLQLVNQVQSPFSGFSSVISQFYNVLASAERIMELENLPGEEKKTAFDAREEYCQLEEIRVENVNFTYGRTQVLEHADLGIGRGDVVSITGISGGGKSTLFLLMMGAYTPTQGRILFRFHGECREPDESTRRLFAYVPQGNCLMAGTLRENVAFFREDVSDETIREALRLACADAFVAELPEGLDTVLGERGHGLSAGQMQRIAIARAIASGAPILMLDEATSALDEATEAKLLTNIRKLENRTCLIVTHRPAALSICNRHIRIAAGRAEEYT